MRFRSSYPFGQRYFSAFFGLGLVTVSAGLDIALRYWQSLALRMPEQRRAAATVVAVVALAATFGAPRFAYALVSEVRVVRRPPKNFSPYFRAYAEIVDAGKSAFVIHTHCWTNDIPALYFYFIVRAARPAWPLNMWLYWGDALGCEEPLSALKSRVGDFLAKHMADGGAIVLDDKERDCGNRSVPAVPPPASVERFHSVSACMWKVRGVSTLAQLADVAERVHFSAAHNLR